ncbi:MAG: hypothetical protein M3Z17_03455 [Gemmatimonadota bacterium]|nr:hypothetical protein [Gemmatimonadota bacterium]
MTRKTFALIACCLISPAIAAAQTGGLTKVQLLALQQELKDQCGLAHSTGVMDGPTRHAIAVCNKKYGTQGNGAALLTAMNVGFNVGDNEPAGGMGGMMGNDHDMAGMSMGGDSAYHAKMKAKMGTRTRMRARGAAKGTNRGGMDSDAWKKGVDSTSGGVDVDARTVDRKMAHDSAMAGQHDGRVRNPGQGKRAKAGRDSVKH